MLNSIHNLKIALLCSCVMFSSATAGEISPEVMKFFENEVRPLLAENCWSCHNDEEQKGALRLDTRGHMLLGGESGESIVPGKPDESLLMEAVRYESYEMPPSGKLKNDQIKILEKWITIGAPWPGADDTVPVRKETGPQFTDEDRQWWAIQPVKEVQVPTPATKDWALNDVDRFILAAQEQHELAPAPEASRESLIRRLYFDLHGLPPSPEEVREFVADARPDAYERLVDRLLESPRYGERWARHWLDVVRYADSDGYRADGYRPNAWRYRDYVIRSLNEDKPYDQFVKEQLAGDELYPHDPEALIATGFLTHGIYEWNQRDVVGQWDIMLNELTDTVGDVFMGVGMQCARCHDHKFDPVLQKDYFQLRAFFEPIMFPTDEVAATPEQLEKYNQELAAWEKATEDLRKQIAELEAPVRKSARDSQVKMFPADIQVMINKPAEERTPREHQLAELAWRQVEYRYDRIDKQLKGETKEKVIALRKKLAEYNKLKPSSLPTVQLVTDVGTTAPETVIPKKRTKCDPGFLALMEQPIDEYMTSEYKETTGRRTALAEWLTEESNPLSTRVIVNRVWQYHFGQGLAPHSSDFGRLGGPPSHPELLDWLTRQFLDGGWRFKSLHRLIVTSATYRQSTLHPRYEELVSVDPQNKYYWRSETRRLDAEQIRDSVLAVTGQLNLKMGGAGANGNEPRRSVYLRVKRNSRDPLLGVFDLPQFFSSTAARDTTTSPIQSLQLFNSQQMLRFADQLSKRAHKEAASTEDDQEAAAITRAWEIVFGRDITEEELAMAQQFVSQQTELLSNQETMVNLEQFETTQMPYRNGQSVVLHPEKPSPFYVKHHERLNPENFTVEAYFQLQSVYDSGSVRVIASKWNGNSANAGWSFGVTGKGSRRKPQTLVFHAYGDLKNGKFGEAAIFSDQHIEINTPYYAAASVHITGERAGTIDFYLKDLSNDDEQLGVVAKKHQLIGGLGNKYPVAIGRMASKRQSYFDGLIDDVRLSSDALEVQDLLFTDEAISGNTLGYWRFDPVPGMFRDSSPHQHDITHKNDTTSDASARSRAFDDLCHVLLNSNEFLYLH
ncbi:DUF1549 domain-containing protein [Calycomorphotria hydatis]|uniref:Planctomycete cytochrome C n=1 Tax=Calycomorphotria hydatis TaxID=2528027 RepID=A0A517TD53_9PLAN|nr:DUF1549 domain-containing protein [Calycomorphotria hydatis]QDT66311.1 Planctomycete cytochrome C [Calycomorphotria hydatis]